MSLSIGVIFGIIAMLGWGTADFFVAIAVRKTSVFKTFIWSQIIGAVLLLLIFSMFFKLPILSLPAIGIILIATFLYTVAYFAFYKGLQVGKVSIISPVAACWAVVTVILSLIFLGETLTPIKALGASLAILGAVLTSFRLHDLLGLRLKNLTAGVGYAIIAVIGWGIYFVFVDVLVSEFSWFLPMLFVKIVSVFYLLTYSGIKRENFSFPKNVLPFIILIGALEVIAYLCYGFGVTSEYTAIMASIAAAFPMITIILARIFFKETLEINQKIGIVSILTGLVLLSL